MPKTILNCLVMKFEMKRCLNARNYAIVFNGDVRNEAELKRLKLYYTI